MPETTTRRRRGVDPFDVTPIETPDVETTAAQISALQQVEEQRARMLEDHRMAVSGRFRVLATNYGVSRQAMRASLSALDLPLADPVAYDVVVTYPGVLAYSSEEAARVVRDNVPNGIRSHDLVSRPQAAIATTQASASAATTTNQRSTLAGYAAGQDAIREFDARFYRELVARHAELSDNPESNFGITLPAARPFTVMVPLSVSAFDEESAATIARCAVRSGYRSPALGQYDYVTLASDPAIQPTEGGDSEAQPESPASA